MYLSAIKFIICSFIHSVVCSITLFNHSVMQPTPLSSLFLFLPFVRRVEFGRGFSKTPLLALGTIARRSCSYPVKTERHIYTLDFEFYWIGSTVQLSILKRSALQFFLPSISGRLVAWILRLAEQCMWLVNHECVAGSLDMPTALDYKDKSSDIR